MDIMHACQFIPFQWPRKERKNKQNTCMLLLVDGVWLTWEQTVLVRGE
jgi:hypothetical protein